MLFPAIAVLLCLIFPALVACGHKSTDARKPVAVKGTLDLGGWDFGRGGLVNLDGEWEFFWDRLINPSDFAKNENRKECRFVKLPSLWKGHAVNGASLPGKGRATYRLKIVSGPDNKVKTLIIHRIYSAYKLWINGVMVDRRGEVDSSTRGKEDYIFIHNKRLSSFALNEGINEIVINVFNKHYESGGIDRSIQLDNEETVQQKQFIKHTANMIVVGLVMFFSIYNILLYFFRRKDKTPLYFGIFCFLLTINVFNLQIPILSGPLSYPRNPYLVDYITVVLLIYYCLMTIAAQYPDEVHRPVIRISQILSFGMIVVLMLVGFRTAEQIMNVYFICVLFYIFYYAYVIIRAIIHRRDDAVLFLLGFTTPCFGAFNDTLYALWIIDTINIFQYTMVLLCVITTIGISRRFSRALRTVEKLSRNLTEKNLSLEKLDRLKDQFLANTSHELRTPLHGMIGLSETMLDGAAGELPPKVLDNLSLIASSGHRLASMVNDLLDMAKIQNEGITLILRPVDLRSLSDVVVRLSLPLVGGRNLNIRNNIDPHIPAALADEDRIRQVLCNLVCNAVKFTHRGSVELSARVIGPGNGNHEYDGGAMIEISVTDTGIGIPEEYREMIFEAYRQVDGGDTRSYAGTGLGLAIARKIVELHNGSIGVADREGGGSVFTFTLPVSNNPALQAEEKITIEGLDDLIPVDTIPGGSRLPAGIPEDAFDNHPVLLVVDDDPINVRVVQNFFESKKCVVKTAPDGITALDIIGGDDDIDLVLLDIMMPVMSGYDVCRRIRTTHSPGDLPVIMLTAKNMMSDIDAAFEVGANDYIVKPFQPGELLARVSTMLRLRNVRRSVAEGMTIRDRNRAYSIRFNEIIHITSHSKNVVVHTGERDIELPVQMKEIGDRLPPDMFIRIHKSHIINIRYVRSLSHVLSGRYRVRLKDSEDTELPVGPAFLGPLRKKI